LRSGSTQSCGCLNKEICKTLIRHEDLTGKRFGQLMVIKLIESKDGRIYWLCLCECGNETRVSTSQLKSMRTKSCGCLRRTAGAIHGNCKLPEYAVWCAMKARCNNKNNKAYANYGGRGIRVCQSWSISFQSFISDMGNRPSSQHSLERIDNNLGYSPENCRWATRHDQNRNSRHNVFLTYKGETLCIKDWAKKLSLKPGLIQHRIKIGWSVECALNTPVR
jgi:hypothetical protein